MTDTTEDPQPESLEAAQRRYLSAAHAMQSGVAYELTNGMNNAHEPKHLRTGVNSTLVSLAGIAKVLIAKGILTEEELTIATADLMEAEVDSYEKRISEHLGTAVSLR